MSDVLKQIDWRAHSLRLTAFAVASIFLVYAYVVYDDKTNMYLQTQAQLQQQKNKNRNALDQMEVYEAFYPQYQQLESRGLVGSNFRLQWIETLKKVSEIYRVPGIDFTLHNAEPAIDTSEQYYSDQLPLKTTKMDLSLDMLHEGDWYRLLTYMHQYAHGVFSVEECELVSASEGESRFGGVNGKCSLKWYTMQDITQDTSGDL
ncbi:hypothetical protein TDB9533_03958 [Thalassocella blandensis]|nr:hypothetical protein TDB9533_03958 [Thalassocella blandensis]